MDTHLTDFPIRSARVVTAGVHPATLARTLDIDVEGLVGALKASCNEDIGEVNVHPNRNTYRAPVGVELPAHHQCPDLVENSRWHPHVVAMRFDAERLRKVREGMDYSQEEFAKAIRAAGVKIGEPNGCTKRAVQKWESGQVKMPRPPLRHALAAVTGMPFVTLCTPVLPPDPDEATREFSAIATDMNELIHRLARLYSYLIR